jgi:hypothetical protein
MDSWHGRQGIARAEAAAPKPAVDLIEHAAGVIIAKQREPHTAPYHWAGALWEAGMLVPPGAGEDQRAWEARVRAQALRDFAAVMRASAEEAPADEPVKWPWSAYALAAVKAEEHARLPRAEGDQSKDLLIPEEVGVIDHGLLPPKETS